MILEKRHPGKSILVSPTARQVLSIPFINEIEHTLNTKLFGWELDANVQQQTSHGHPSFCVSFWLFFAFVPMFWYLQPSPPLGTCWKVLEYCHVATPSCTPSYWLIYHSCLITMGLFQHTCFNIQSFNCCNTCIPMYLFSMQSISNLLQCTCSNVMECKYSNMNPICSNTVNQKCSNPLLQVL